MLLYSDAHTFEKVDVQRARILKLANALEKADERLLSQEAAHGVEKEL